MTDDGHISKHALARLPLGMVAGEAELAPMEEHLFICADCIRRAEEARDYIETMRAKREARRRSAHVAAVLAALKEAEPAPSWAAGAAVAEKAGKKTAPTETVGSTIEGGQQAISASLRRGADVHATPEALSENGRK